MEEDEYRATYRAINQRRCVFEKAINSRRASCAQSERFCLADREGVACRCAESNALCSELLVAMRRKARFALQLTRAENPLPHNKEIRVQTGGLLGLQEKLYPQQAGQETVDDIDGLIRQALGVYGCIDALPYGRIVQSIVAFRGRRRRARDNGH